MPIYRGTTKFISQPKIKIKSIKIELKIEVEVVTIYLTKCKSIIEWALKVQIIADLIKRIRSRANNINPNSSTGNSQVDTLQRIENQTWSIGAAVDYAE